MPFGNGFRNMNTNSSEGCLASSRMSCEKTLIKSGPQLQLLYDLLQLLPTKQLLLASICLWNRCLRSNNNSNNHTIVVIIAILFGGQLIAIRAKYYSYNDLKWSLSSPSMVLMALMALMRSKATWSCWPTILDRYQSSSVVKHVLSWRWAGRRSERPTKHSVATTLRDPMKGFDSVYHVLIANELIIIW